MAASRWLLLSVLWWAWPAYAWLTNTVDPEEGAVRMVMFAAIAAMLIASLAARALSGATPRRSPSRN